MNSKNYINIALAVVSFACGNAYAIDTSICRYLYAENKQAVDSIKIPEHTLNKELLTFDHQSFGKLKEYIACAMNLKDFEYIKTTMHSDRGLSVISVQLKILKSGIGNGKIAQFNFLNLDRNLSILSIVKFDGSVVSLQSDPILVTAATMAITMPEQQRRQVNGKKDSASESSIPASKPQPKNSENISEQRKKEWIADNDLLDRREQELNKREIELKNREKEIQSKERKPQEQRKNPSPDIQSIRWTGTISCGPRLDEAGKGMNAYTVPADVNIFNNKVKIFRANAQVEETLTGTIENGNVTMTGGGFWVANPSRKWEMKTSGAINTNDGSYLGNGNMFLNGKAVRVCQVAFLKQR